MEFTSAGGERRYAGVVEAAGGIVIGLDFDGTLAPIVDDPARASIHPDAADALVAVAPYLRAVAVVTGRPAGQVLELGRLEELSGRLREAGTELRVLGQYGNERWSSTRPRVVSPEPPPGLTAFRRELPALLANLTGPGEPFVEDKGIAIAVHTRRMPDPEGAFGVLLPLLDAAAEDHDLEIEPGRFVVEVRAPGMDKGVAVTELARVLDPTAFVFAGDDLGDLEAFRAVDTLAGEGLPTLLVCSSSEEEAALAALADVVVPGPDGVVALLRTLAGDLAEHSAIADQGPPPA